jgi:serine O-acetyltransferase
MDERDYVAQALLDRLRDEGVEHRRLPGDALELAVSRDAIAAMPRRVARFCQDYDLKLVQLARTQPQRWELVLAWSDEFGRPSFLAVHVLADYHRAGRRLLRSGDLLGGAPAALFAYGLLEAMERQAIDDAHGDKLASLWHADRRGAIERLGRFWRARRDIRLIARAAKRSDWAPVRSELPALRRALHRAVLPAPGALLAALWARLHRRLQPRAALVAFVGIYDDALRGRVAEDLAGAFPGGLAIVDAGFSGRQRRGDVGVLFDPPPGFRARFDEVVTVERGTLAAAVQVEAALLRWLERRVERRYPEAVVGANPLAARILQFAVRRRIPVLSDVVSVVLNCGIDCPLPSPVLMPRPYGIFIDRHATIGSRVTILQQVAIGTKYPADPGVPVIEDNVWIGAGAKILGPVTVGRGAIVGANAVVTRDVPSHCTVVGANRIVGAGTVAAERQLESDAVVNT